MDGTTVITVSFESVTYYEARMTLGEYRELYGEDAAGDYLTDGKTATIPSLEGQPELPWSGSAWSGDGALSDRLWTQAAETDSGQTTVTQISKVVS